MSSLTLRSPAKINLYLKVTNKRKDGYHNIVTLFERIDLHDELRFKVNKSGKIKISCKHPQVPKGPKNLVHQVAQMIKKDFAIENGVDIHINKRIPVAAGLGGGSSNAATAIIGLNKVWKLSMKPKEMLQYAQKIGADVSFFLHDCSWALGTERGDLIQKVSLNNRLWHILVVPRIKLYARKVYQELDLEKISKGPKASKSPLSQGPAVPKKGGRAGEMNMLTKVRDDVNILIRKLRKNNISEVSEFLVNDLESSIFGLCPKLLDLKIKVEQLDSKGVAVSGSGPSVFGLAETKKQAEKISSALKKRYSQVYVVRTL